jgi:hypothetical protein
MAEAGAASNTKRTVVAPKAVAPKAVAPKAVALKSGAAHKPIVWPKPHFHTEWTRKQVMCRCGKGPGSSLAIKYKADGHAKAVKEAEKWVKDKLEQQAVIDARYKNGVLWGVGR